MKTKQTHIINNDELLKYDRTYESILKNKVLDKLEETSLNQVYKGLGIGCGTFLLAGFIINPEQSAFILIDIFTYNNHIIPKIFGSFLIVANINKLADAVSKKSISLMLYLREKEIKKIQTIEGIPTIELIDYLFEKESFKVNDVETRFGISRNKFEVLAKKLDYLKIVIRGANNSRILNPDITRHEIVENLMGAQKASELTGKSFYIGNNTYTNQPIMKKTIINRIKEVVKESFKFNEIKEKRTTYKNHKFLNEKVSDPDFNNKNPKVIDLRNKKSPFTSLSPARKIKIKSFA